MAINLECELADAGYEVVGPAPGVAEALQLIESEAIDVAVLDINIAGELVWPVAAALAERNVPFVLASANCHDPQMVLPAFADTPCFDKPVAMARMIAMLSAMTEPKALAS